MLCKLRVVKSDSAAEELDSAPVGVTCNYVGMNFTIIPTSLNLIILAINRLVQYNDNYSNLVLIDQTGVTSQKSAPLANPRLTEIPMDDGQK